MYTRINNISTENSIMIYNVTCRSSRTAFHKFISTVEVDNSIIFIIRYTYIYYRDGIKVPRPSSFPPQYYCLENCDGELFKLNPILKYPKTVFT